MEKILKMFLSNSPAIKAILIQTAKIAVPVSRPLSLAIMRAWAIQAGKSVMVTTAIVN